MPGLFPQNLDVNSFDDNGNLRVRFGFTFFDDRGPIQDYFFSHLHGDDGPGVVTSRDLQGLTAQPVGDQGAPSLLERGDARLVTVSDPRRRRRSHSSSGRYGCFWVGSGSQSGWSRSNHPSIRLTLTVCGPRGRHDRSPLVTPRQRGEPAGTASGGAPNELRP
jgi:hypothetical protein